eukprot:TRINITY_DN43648_c0_g1_i1.p1 TRINITY_DN43648_c0_g1~~TRINITY_DN43648_c0_g1_i1.p1  ORF type:complete len:493 (+),score=113.78 TRINITY_DN43648_c0_g1_i1:2-1480(+)
MSSRKRSPEEMQRAEAKRPKADILSDSDDDAPMIESSAWRSKQGKLRKAVDRVCPFLDTVDRRSLDFDFAKVCSVSLSDQHVYACLVCGNYFQGRGPGTHAAFHALEAGHHVFINMKTKDIYCLPDNYKVTDRSLDDIKYMVDPTYEPDEVCCLDQTESSKVANDGRDYYPGYRAFNVSTLPSCDYACSVLQMLCHVPDLRDFFLNKENYSHCHGTLVASFGELVRKIWAPRALKCAVSPDEMLQAVSAASLKKYRVGQQNDPIPFLVWLLNNMHRELGGSSKKKTIITETFQGELECTTTVRADVEDFDGNTKKQAVTSAKKNKFLVLGVDIPPPPLFKDSIEGSILPQIPLPVILSKYDGKTEHIYPDGTIRKYQLTKLPKFLLLHLKRFTKNTFDMDKNPTIVTFTVTNLEMKDLLKDGDKVKVSRYHCLSSIAHVGKGVPEEGTYKTHIKHQGSQHNKWFELEDQYIQEILPEVVALSEAYVQCYQLS